jgi:hypothetical protein
VPKLLLPEYPLWDRRLTDGEIHAAAGFLKLHNAWMVHDEAERQKIKRFMAVYADEADRAVQIVQSRFVSTLEQLEDLLQQSQAAAIMDGAL